MKLSSGIYTASKPRKARTKTTLIKFLLSRNIRSLRNTTHSNERHVPITGYCRKNYAKTKYIIIHSVTAYFSSIFPEPIPLVYSKRRRWSVLKLLKSSFSSLSCKGFSINSNAIYDLPLDVLFIFFSKWSTKTLQSCSYSIQVFEYGPKRKFILVQSTTNSMQIPP